MKEGEAIVFVIDDDDSIRQALRSLIRSVGLKVETTRLKEGYLRKNGVPYSENTVVTEYFDRHDETDGTNWFTVTTIVHDLKYLAQDFITSTHFKKEADASKWFPSPCKAK